ncbi:MAG TPA: hypothetical protein H9705_01785 [Candidatus Fusicatenibacter intestinigallinarum]|uniref:Uncharacterized protein n=1 Tax=Candidatus Fusicatenibacter intestinigallinarum TaxID=2838598 RepID=A0A9D2SM94_9FIRM|nr:hypothetical protein [Candidatus Fusicatenibacter intestinigallinarum]
MIRKQRQQAGNLCSGLLPLFCSLVSFRFTVPALSLSVFRNWLFGEPAGYRLNAEIDKGSDAFNGEASFCHVINSLFCLTDRPVLSTSFSAGLQSGFSAGLQSSFSASF